MPRKRRRKKANANSARNPTDVGDKIMCIEYNGWSNRETWAAALWINNDQGMYEAFVEAGKYEDTVLDLSQAIEGYITDELSFESVSENRILFDMMQDIGSLYRVDWYEIADTFFQEIKEEAV